MRALDWSALGKPDFSEVGRWFYRLDPSLREGMNRSEERTLIWTLFFAWIQGQRWGRPSAYATFSEAGLGARFGRSRWTVARAVARLVDLGLLRVIRRRPDQSGEWQTNLYQLCPRLLEFLGRMGAKSAKLLRVANPPHKNHRNDTISAGGGSTCSSAPPAQEEDNPPCTIPFPRHLFARFLSPTTTPQTGQ